MVKFIEVDPDQIPNYRESHRGRVSYPILKSFLETGKPLVMLDRTGMQQSLQSLMSSLSAYIRNHKLPIKLFMRTGQVYLARLDTDEKGVPDSHHNNISNIDREDLPTGKAPDELLLDETIPLVTADEVKKKFLEEKDKVTK